MPERFVCVAYARYNVVIVCRFIALLSFGIFMINAERVRAVIFQSTALPTEESGF